jgi:methylenetetrahydrofolate reductase (NADPH)
MAALRTCIEQLYLEVFPVRGIEQRLMAMPDGSHIGITCSPRQGLDITLELVERMQGHHFELVPHVAARQVRDRAQLKDIVARLSEQGVKALFVPGGDIAKPLGSYASSLDLLRDLAEVGHSFDHIGVAAHPEGHPDIDDDTLFEALLAKQQFATYFVTQMCFDPSLVARWLQHMRSRGIVLPGVVDRMKLFRTSLRIGVGESARFARKQSSLAGKLLKSSCYRPDELVLNLAPAVEDAELGVGGFYLFSFNQVQDTIAWREEVLARLASGDLKLHEPDRMIQRGGE